MSQVQISSRRKQAGITSLFVVIFSAILLSVITMSFASLMNREMQRSSDDELSQSAYDSAMAGVEDAKRVIMLAQEDTSAGQDARNAIATGDCKTIAIAKVAGDDSQRETVIQSSSGAGEELNQAYTCVTISLNNEDYEGSTEQMRSAFVPLKGVSSFNKVRIEWHATDLSNQLEPSCGNADLGFLGLCMADDWGPQNTVPALLRSQLITPGSDISYSTLDSQDGGTTTFLYPKNLASGSETEVNMDALQRYVNTVAGGASGLINQPETTACVATPGFPDTYRCEATLTLSEYIDGGSEISLLRLTPIYNAASFRVTLLDDDDVVEFDGVQPVVDSTGRANDLFRRVEARLSLVSEADYPEFAVDVDGDICKDFFVYSGKSNRTSGTCSP